MTERRGRSFARITLAELHVIAGEPESAHLAAQAIDSVAELASARTRARLLPLIDALEARRDSTCTELAHRARMLRASA